ncbi:MAG: glycoside hydrolase family 127 protein, partial [Muribaculaceae bacterium]|nr:glycoside hydrolase family 127 protein [Muribaculaceae bacterium]
EQDEAVGHAVRATYMYAGMADVAALTGDTAYSAAVDRIWENIVSKKFYITGGIGATSHGEAFGQNYELPNMSAYCETCAAIGNVYVNHRLFLLHGHSKYYDVLERTLYNGLISGVSIDGGAFFYPNPLESVGQHQRQPWFGCACCPSNICRFIPSLPGYIYAVDNRDVFVNLFMSNTASLDAAGKKNAITISQSTSYPWNGDISLTVDKNAIGSFALKIRIPGWVLNRPVPSDLYSYADSFSPSYSVTVNGRKVESDLENGYFTISKKWKRGDRVDVHFDMPPRIVTASNKVAADRGRVAVERGPLVYCAEWPDNNFDIQSVLIGQKPELRAVRCDTTLNGLTKITANAQALALGNDGRLRTDDVTLSLIPYYAWNHRGPGAMAVWLPADVSAVRPSRASLASGSRISASVTSPALAAITDGKTPETAN